VYVRRSGNFTGGILNLKKSRVLSEQKVNVVSSVPKITVGPLLNYPHSTIIFRFGEIR